MIFGDALEADDGGADLLPVLNRGDARIQVKRRCSAAVRNVQRKGQAGAIENSVVQGDIRMAALNLFADSQNVRLIDGVVFLLGMESRDAEICAAPAVAARRRASSAKARDMESFRRMCGRAFP